MCQVVSRPEPRNKNVEVDNIHGSQGNKSQAETAEQPVTACALHIDSKHHC